MPFNFTEHDIAKFPFQDYSHCQTQEELDELADYHQLYHYQEWMLPQVWAHFGQWRVSEPKWRAVGRENIGDHWQQGLWRVVTQLNRGKLVKPQTKFAKYGALTPIILAAIREHQGIPYASWDVGEDCQLVERKLLDSMTIPCPRLTREELIQVQKTALVYRSGAKSGQQKKPESTWSLGELRGTPLYGTTPLQKVMLLQVWLAHPTQRHPLMILDPNSWDQVPEPLITPEPFHHTTPKQIQDFQWIPK